MSMASPVSLSTSVRASALERMMARQEIAARMATKAHAEAGKDVAWEDVAFALQRQSRRKRAMDEMLDFARREYAAHEDELHELRMQKRITALSVHAMCFAARENTALAI